MSKYLMILLPPLNLASKFSISLNPIHEERIIAFHALTLINPLEIDINTNLNASVMSENRKIGAYLFASHRTRSEYDRDLDGFSEAPKLRSTTAGLRSFFKTSAYSKLTLEYHHTTIIQNSQTTDAQNTAPLALFDSCRVCFVPILLFGLQIVAKRL